MRRVFLTVCGVLLGVGLILTDGPKAQIGTGPGVGIGTVRSVSVTTANGVSGAVATATTTPAITLTLGAITPTTISLGGNLTFSNATPTLSSGFGTNADASFATGSTAAAFDMNIGTGGSPTSGVIGLPTAAHGWACQVTDISHVLDVTSQTAYTTASASFSTTVAWTANDHLVGGCVAF